MPDRGCAFCWPLTPRGRIVLGPRIGICEGCAGDIQEALRSPPASAAQIPGHRPVPNANGRHTAFYAGRGVSVAGIQPVPLGIPGFTGDACAICNSFTMIRSGTCQTCLSCGETSGCS